MSEYDVRGLSCDFCSFAITAWEIFTRHRPTLDLRQTEKPHPYTVFMNIGKGSNKFIRIIII